MDTSHHYTRNSNTKFSFCHTIVEHFLKGSDVVSYRNKLKVASLKNLVFLAVLKLDVKDYCGYNKELESTEKAFPIP